MAAGGGPDDGQLASRPEDQTLYMGDHRSRTRATKDPSPAMWAGCRCRSQLFDGVLSGSIAKAAMSRGQFRNEADAASPGNTR